MLIALRNVPWILHTRTSTNILRISAIKRSKTRNKVWTLPVSETNYNWQYVQIFLVTASQHLYINNHVSENKMINTYSREYLFSLLSTNGRIIPCNLVIKSLFLFAVPSIMLLMGLLNQYENSFLDRNTWGIKKCSNDHNSIKLFWSGVPVSNRRRWVLKFIRVCQRWDWKFLIFWASSRII